MEEIYMNVIYQTRSMDHKVLFLSTMFLSKFNRSTVRSRFKATLFNNSKPEVAYFGG